MLLGGWEGHWVHASMGLATLAHKTQAHITPVWSVGGEVIPEERGQAT